MTGIFVRASDGWRPARVWVRAGGQWKRVTAAWVHTGGAWRRTWPPRPAAPVLSHPATAHSSKTLRLTWPEVSHARRYVVERKIDSGAWEAVQTLADNKVTTGFSEKPSQIGSYQYRVAGANDAGVGPWGMSGAITVSGSLLQTTFTLVAGRQEFSGCSSGPFIWIGYSRDDLFIFGSLSVSGTSLDELYTSDGYLRVTAPGAAMITKVVVNGLFTASLPTGSSSLYRALAAGEKPFREGVTYTGIIYYYSD